MAAVRSQPRVDATSAMPTEGGMLVLTCSANHSIPAPTFVWTRDGTPVTSSPSSMIQTRSEVGREGVLSYVSDLTLGSVQTTDSGTYVCSVTQSDPVLSSPLITASSPFNIVIYSKTVLFVCLSVRLFICLCF